MRKRHLCLASTVLLFALLCLGCSNDNPVTPTATENTSPSHDGLTDKTDTGTVTVWGNVYLYGGTVPAVNTKVTIQTDSYQNPGVFATWATVRTNEYGYFECPAVNVAAGCSVRCASLGDIETQGYDGVSAYMFFLLVEVPGTKVPRERTS